MEGAQVSYLSQRKREHLLCKTMRSNMVGLLLLAVMAGAVRKNPVTDTMEGIGNTAGTVQDGAGSATSAVGGDTVASGAGSVVTGAGGAVGGAASTVGGAVGAG